MTKKSLQHFPIYFFICLFLSAASSSWLAIASNADYSDKYEPATLRVNLGAEPPSLDWAKATDATSFDVVINIMVGLTAYTKDLSCAPACACSWEVLDKGKCYRFH